MSDPKEQILKIIGKPFLGALATLTEDGKPWARYVVALANESDMTISFATFVDSRKVEQIKANPMVHLTAGANEVSETAPYVQIEGTAELVVDRKKRHVFWCDIPSDFFEGPDDPRYSLIEIHPTRIELWATNPKTLAKPEVWEP